MKIPEWLKSLGEYPLFELGKTNVTVLTLALFAIVVIITLAASALSQRALVRAMTFRRITDEGTVGVARRLLHYFVLLVGLGIGLQLVGVNLKTLFAAGAVFAIGVGFAMQNIAQNFVSGLIILLERTIKPGDILQVEGRFVRVRQMGIRCTIARTLDDEEIIVPNSAIAQSSVTNYTLNDSVFRLRTSVGVHYTSDMKLVKETLQKTADQLTWRHKDKQPAVFMIEFGDSAVVFEVSVWMEDPWHSQRARSNLNEAIWWALKDNGIVIAYPQLDVHLNPQ